MVPAPRVCIAGPDLAIPFTTGGLPFSVVVFVFVSIPLRWVGRRLGADAAVLIPRSVFPGSNTGARLESVLPVPPFGFGEAVNVVVADGMPGDEVEEETVLDPFVCPLLLPFVPFMLVLDVAFNDECRCGLTRIVGLCGCG